MHQAFDKPPHKGATYSKPPRPGTFVLFHYAGQVIYTIDGFIDKNKDELSATISALLEQHTDFDALKEVGGGQRLSG